MKNLFSPVFLFIFSATAFAQHKLSLRVTERSALTGSSVFVAGNFNNWNPRDSAYMLLRGANGQWTGIFTVPAGEYSYKYTRGDWDHAEATAKGEDAQNRLVQVNADLAVSDTVPAWTNKIPGKPRPHTASANVQVLDTSFTIPQLARKRRLWIYLPANYNSTSDKYSVLYMHDGQNLFDEATGSFGEWGVDEALDSLQAQTGKYAIVVGIDHGGDKRMTEYDPYDKERFGKEEGIEYAAFIANTLKPYVDGHYRTKKDAAHTAIAGSSMGGLISTYMILQYPKIFGTAGIFSPSYWLVPELYSMAENEKVKNKNLKFWFYAGEKESKDMVTDVIRMREILENKYHAHFTMLTDPQAGHNEASWRKWFPLFYRQWMKNN